MSRYPSSSKRLSRLLLAALGCLAAARPAGAQVGASTTIFEGGRTHVSGGLGWGQAFDRNYMIVSGGIGYNVVRGLALELEGDAWTANSPAFQHLEPGLRYVFVNESKVYPYLGGFYQHTFYSNFPDADSIGGRAGIYTPVGSNTYLGAGAAVSNDLDCSQRANLSCTVVYPEFSLNYAF